MPRFALFSITAELHKIEYCITYHLKGNFSSLYNDDCTFQEIYAWDIKARNLKAILSLLTKITG